jgi:pSer/pThr/pTyr-binding forkhead associated (FHA) protein
MFGIIRMIYLDIKGIRNRSSITSTYLKLINRRDELPFNIEESYSLDSSITIGRSSKNDIVIKDPFISKRHVSIEKERNEFFIEDLNSANGTFVNEEELLNPIRLENGDNIKIGQASFLFVNEID